jgi:uncharacterized lipoprotein YddW (UPF0748 family)
MDKLLQFMALCWFSTQCTPLDSSQYEKNYIKREFRAVWVVTLDNKDFPTRKGLSTKRQKEDIIEMLDFYQQKGINAIIFQVRPSSDAFYNSPYEPWSEWLTGEQGKAPEPFYDPLTFMIEECHKRNMELHAWFNPYRAVFGKNNKPSPRHIAELRPHWIINYGGMKHLNPGLPEVRNYIQAIVLDVVKRYDIDGVHFDDYFYPYRVGKTDFPDDETFALYKGNFQDKRDWRRENINIFVKNISEGIAKLKPHVKFGISPLGVWRNQKDDPRGSATAVGQASYDYLGADILKWLEKGWVDYIAPQMYWSIGHERADYQVLAEWWAKNNHKRHIYAGLASYKAVMKEDDVRWRNRAELSKQMLLNRKHNLEGVIFFRSKPLMKSWVSDTLYRQFFRYPALMPTMPWKDSIAPLPPANAKLIRTRKRVRLTWEHSLPASDGQKPTLYVIYRATKGETIDFNNPKYMVSMQKTTEWIEKIPEKEAVQYFITALDRLHNESTPIELKSVSAEDF